MDYLPIKERIKQSEVLLATAKDRLPQLKKLLAEVSTEWGYEDPIYRFYHGSFKVYHIQSNTGKIVETLQALMPSLKLNQQFTNITTKGTGKQFEMGHNRAWDKHTRPMVEAFFHAKYMLEMVCKYAKELKEAPQILPSGWAAVLYLYNLR